MRTQPGTHMHLLPIGSTADAALSAALDAAINNKTKPLGSLGMLETLARQLGLIQKTTRPQLQAPAILVFAAVAVVAKFGTSSISNPGPHGLSQILYAYTSSAGNNGSAFGGLNPNTLWYNTSTAFAMLLGRFFVVIPILAIAGNLAGKKAAPPSLGTFPVTGPLFSVLLVSTILIVGALTFFPALSLGPILEHLLMLAGKSF